MWTEQELFSSQTAIEYDANVNYDDPVYTYNGKEITVWTEQNEN
jgi:hypothetical protein